MHFQVQGHRFIAFFPPYRRLDPLPHPSAIPRGPLPTRGTALIWNLQEGEWGSGFRAVRDRPPGVALFVLLPPASELGDTDRVLDLMELCRPHSVLPHMTGLSPEELAGMLRRFPGELPLEITEYLAWRGVEVDTDTRRLLRKTLELSEDLRTVRGLARSLYMSRRALGRRFMTRGLPVPSHWLHFGRVLRASLRLQQPETSLFSVGCELGYPDGFSLSNQLKRLTGLRPSIMRECFGWEWIVESWLFQEAQAGNLSPLLKETLFPTAPQAAPETRRVMGVGESATPGVLRVAEGSPGARRGVLSLEST